MGGLGSAWVLLDPWRWANKPKRETMTEPEMRLLIERDMHRDVCRGLSRCRNHPAPRATYCDVNGFDIWSAGEVTVAEFARPCHATLPEAIDAARALAVANV